MFFWKILLKRSVQSLKDFLAELLKNVLEFFIEDFPKVFPISYLVHLLKTYNKVIVLFGYYERLPEQILKNFLDSRGIFWKILWKILYDETHSVEFLEGLWSFLEDLLEN